MRHRNVQGRVSRGGAQQGAGEGGLAGAERAFQQQRVAGAQQRRQRGRQTRGRREVRQRERAGGRGRRHLGAD
jgi:hypothetical protein